MADDWDELLDEVEPKFCRNVSLTPQLQGNTGQLPKTTKTKSLPQATGKSCDQLKCISCDFRVAMFDDHEWDPSCDDLFFRSNMRDCQKLRAKLRRRKGAQAHAYQCSWHSARDLTDLREQHQLKWVWGKHDM
ncbi:cilia- and flagella-associated protein 418-like [Salvelinus fontinalis]|uniref:cilia- and flagella-associated protein 418-like n=1 Tax=Salvelinus fontinalis TaxID=8038 RepID=UPI00248598CA|nr:cilia- and flagella-associated protein 418-like [Salvelinus fontinalis]